MNKENTNGKYFFPLSPTVSDIIKFAQPTLRHRISLNFEARADLINIDQMIKKVCEDLD